MKKIIKNIVFLSAATLLIAVLILVVLEAYLRIFSVEPMTPGHLSTNAMRRYTLKPCFSGKTYSADFRINSLGLRGDETHISKNAYRIAIFGDSITFGIGVDDSKTFPKLIENDLNTHYSGKPRIQVLNCGVPSYNTVQEYRYIIDSYDIFKPDMIIVQFSTQNDIIMLTDINSYLNKYRFVRFIKDKLRYLYSYRFLASMYYGLKFKKLEKSYGSPYAARYSIDSFYYEENYPGWIDAKKAFRDIKEFCENNNIALVFVIYANNFKLSHTPEEDIMYSIIKKVTATLRGVGIKHIIVIDNAFRSYAGREELLWITSKDAHFSELAHKLTADEIAAYIYKNNLISE